MTNSYKGKIIQIWKTPVDAGVRYFRYWLLELGQLVLGNEVQSYDDGHPDQSHNNG